MTINLESLSDIYTNFSIYHQVKIDIPELMVMNSTIELDSPMVMAKIAKKNQFTFSAEKK